MRNHILLLTAMITLAACGDQHPVSPSMRSSDQSRGDVAPSTQGIKVPQAKPTDQVGFTNVFTVDGNSVGISVGDGPRPVTATCPAGSQAIGGGYGVSNWAASRFLTITGFGLDGANGWTAKGWVWDVSAPTVFVTPHVICIQ